jgi:cyclopropane fatty-acyl-phospholipid synthase-like methyltransferase
MPREKPFSQACENNKAPILEILQRVFAHRERVLEIGSGTGQHAVHFAPQLPHLLWQTSDLEHNHEGIRAWLDEHPADNLLAPVVLDADHPPWSCGPVDAVFMANTCHIMAWTSLVNLFAGLNELLSANAVLAVYGPFNYQGKFTSDSNARFDQWLKQQAPHQGIRAFEAVNELASGIGLTLLEDNAMPANNRLLVWCREAGNQAPENEC